MSLGRAEWLHADRARGWCTILAVLLVIWLAVWLGTSHHGRDRSGDPLAADFICYWTAGHLAASGQAASVYDPGLLNVAEHAAIHFTPKGFFGFYYPPIFLLICVPLVLMPYWLAILTFLAAGFVPLFLALRRLLPQPWGILPILSFPGMLVTAGNGQNGFFTAACFAGFTVLLDRLPFLAGACLGGLAAKPHLALLVPVALFAARRWQAVAGAACGAIGLSLLAWAAFGTSAWLGFLHSLPLARSMLETALLDPSKLQSAFGAVRILHGGITTGYVVQSVATLLAVMLLARTAWRRPGGPAEGATLTAAGLLATPYLVDYDLACLAVPLAWLLGEAARTGWRRWEKYAGLAAFALPIIGRGIAHTYGIPLSPFILTGLLLVVAGRAGSLTRGVEFA